MMKYPTINSRRDVSYDDITKLIDLTYDTMTYSKKEEIFAEYAEFYDVSVEELKTYIEEMETWRVENE